MSASVANLFPVVNADDLAITYRLWHVVGLADTGDVERNLNLAAKRVGVMTKNPVAVVRTSRGRALALPEDVEAPDRVHLTPAVVQLRRDDETDVARPAGDNENERQIGEAFLRFALRGALMRNSQLWGGTSSVFLTRPWLTRDGIDMYAGFKWSVVYYEGHPFITIDPTFRYHEAASPSSTPKKMAHALYAKGLDWYDIQILAVSDLTVSDAEFRTDDGTTWTVASYAERFSPDVKLDPSGRAIVYRYPNRVGQQSHGALELVRLRRHTENIEHTGLHRRSILKPPDRIARSVEAARFFDGVSLGTHRLEVSSEPQVIPSESLMIPRLRYHDGSVLDPNQDLAGYPRARMRRLYAAAAKHELIIDTQYILVPRQSINRSTGDSFRDSVEQALRSLTGSKHMRVEKVIYDAPSRKSTQAHLDAIVGALKRANLRGGAALLILPSNAPSELHNAVKAELEDWRFQCIEARTVNRFFASKARDRAAGVLENTCLGLMLANRLYPFSVDEELVGDVHVGVDIRNDLAAFVFVADGGRRIAIETIPVTAGERLHTGAVKRTMIKGLKSVLTRLELREPHIVYHRDGRAFSNEIDGLQAAINALIDDGVVTQDTRYSVVEILKKTGAPVRLYRDDNDTAGVGDYLVLDEHTGVVVLTGAPFNTGGTPDPLMVHVRCGDYSIRDALNDVLAYAQLAYQAPGASLGLPATNKLADDLVTERGSDYDVDDARYGTAEEEDLEVRAEASARHG